MNKEERIVQLLGLLDKEPNDVFLNYVLGIEYLNGGKPEAAKQQLLRSLELDPNHIASYYHLGKLYASSGEQESALKYLRQGSELAREKGDLKSRSEFEEAIFLLED